MGGMPPPTGGGFVGGEMMPPMDMTLVKISMNYPLITDGPNMVHDYGLLCL